MLIGVVLLGFGIVGSLRSEAKSFLLVMGALMCAYGIAVFAAAKKLAQK